MRYVVEVKEPLPEDLSLVAGRVAEAFSISDGKAMALLRRGPGAVTKPISEQEAHVVAGLFRRSGLNVVTRLEGADLQGHGNGLVGERVVVNDPRQVGSRLTPVVSSPAFLTTSYANGWSGDDSSNGWSVDDFPPVPEAARERSPLLSTVEDALMTGRRPLAGRAPGAGAVIGTIPAPDANLPSVVRERRGAPTAPGSRASGSRAPGSRAANVAERVDASERRPRRASVRRKILLAGIAPALLTIGAALAAVVVTVGPALRTQLLEAARNPAIAFANGVEALLGERGLAEPAVLADLQAMTLLSQAEFREQNIAFVLITDAEGNRLAGWYQDSTSLEAVPDALGPAIESRARGAAASAYAEQNGIERGNFDPPSRRVEVGGTAIEMAAEPIRGEDRLAIGAVVVGITTGDIAQRIRTVLLGTLAAGLVPVLIGIIAAMALTRALTRNIFFLIGAADKISRGELSTQVELDTDDELGDLSRAIERMRVSLEEGLVRLRRRRR